MAIEPTDNLDIAKKYLAAVESGVTGDALAAFFTPDVVQEEFPNRLVPTGARRDLTAILDAAMRGGQVTSAQRYEILRSISSGNDVALEVQWTATLRVPVGNISAGGQMCAHFAVFLEFRDGKIARQRNYDCFEPW